MRSSMTGFRGSAAVGRIPPRQSLYGQRAEGPDMYSSIENMRASTVILHNRHAMR